MSYVNYSILCSGFIADLVTKATTAGWVLSEAGYNGIRPADYSGFHVLITQVYGSIPDNTGSASSYNFTHFLIKVRATWNTGTHVPTTTANGGDYRLRMFYNSDQTASATSKYYVKGWIGPNHICLAITGDPAIPGATQILFLGEVEAVDAAANTCMALATEMMSGEIGQGTYDGSNVYSSMETHFIHVLGDSCSYYPYIYGMGVSFASNKVRPSPCYIWRREGGTEKPYQLYYRIPLDIARFTLGVGIEAEDDTFVDTDTFTRQARISSSYCGTAYMQQFYDGNTPSSKMAGYWWIVSAQA